jgi:energy-coupling factor transporter ATP-binding protein EcfA2
VNTMTPADRDALAALKRLGGRRAGWDRDTLVVFGPGSGSVIVGKPGAPGAVMVRSGSWPPMRWGQVYNADDLNRFAAAWNNGNGHHPVDVDQPDWRAETFTADDMGDGDDDDAYDWLVPGLLERGDRLVLCGYEGGGKSTLLRQLGTGIAAGVNGLATLPQNVAHEPGRVLMIDCENSRQQVRREMPKAWRHVADERGEWGPRFTSLVRPGGLVLDDPADVDGHRAMLAEMVDVLQPDVLLIGPHYKLLGGDPNTEQDARGLVLFLDRLRAQHPRMMAVVLEAHAPHGEQRPAGWSGLKRWPEHGLYLTADGALRPFRGCRDAERSWPTQLRRGTGREWLWMPGGPTGAEVVDLDAERVARVRQIVQRVLHIAKRPLTMAEITDRAGRRSTDVRQAVAHYEDRGWLTVGREPRPDRNGRPRQVDVYSLRPDGPQGDHDA